MFHKALSIGGMLLLAGAAVLITPGLSQAQRGGGHGGGHMGGGFHGGFNPGFHGGVNPGFHGGFNPGFRGGFNPTFHRGFNPAFRGGFNTAFRHSGFGFRAFVGLGYYPYYGGLSYSYPYYSSSPDVGSDLTYDPAYTGSYSDVTPPAADSTSLYPPATNTPQTDTLAHVTVKVPADARVWLQNAPMTSTGSVRQFDSPPLVPGRPYHYEIRATWNENGREVTQTQQVGITAGASVEVDFPMRSEPAGPPAATTGH